MAAHFQRQAPITLCRVVLFDLKKLMLVNSYWLIVIRYWLRKSLIFKVLQISITAFT
jgi:hypothetical protein